MKNIRELNSEDEKELNPQEYYYLMELDDLIRDSFKGDRAGYNSPIFLEIESGCVVELSLVSCCLSSIPHIVFEFKKLKILYLNRNRIKSIPESIKKLTSLEVLSIADNKIGNLPESLTKVTSLQSLNLADNIIASLPNSIGNLKQLSHLALNNNRLESLPESIGLFGLI